MQDIVKNWSARRKPEGLSGRGMWNPGSEAVGWDPRTGPETISYDLSWFRPVKCEDIPMMRTSSTAEWWVGKRNREKVEGGPTCAEVMPMVSSEEGHVPDHLRHIILLLRSFLPSPRLSI